MDGDHVQEAVRESNFLCLPKIAVVDNWAPRISSGLDHDALSTINRGSPINVKMHIRQSVEHYVQPCNRPRREIMQLEIRYSILGFVVRHLSSETVCSESPVESFAEHAITYPKNFLGKSDGLVHTGHYTISMQEALHEQ